MYLLSDLRVMKSLSFSDVHKWLPSAKTIRVFYCCQWAPLLVLPVPEGVTIDWVNCHDYYDAMDYFEECAQAASVQGSPDEIILLDRTSKDGETFYKQYINGSLKTTSK